MPVYAPSFLPFRNETSNLSDQLQRTERIREVDFEFLRLSCVKADFRCDHVILAPRSDVDDGKSVMTNYIIIP